MARIRKTYCIQGGFWKCLYCSVSADSEWWVDLEKIIEIKVYPKLLSPRPEQNLCVVSPLISPGMSFSDSPGKQQRGLPVRLSRCLTFGKGAARFLNFLEENPGPTIWDLEVVCPSAEWAFCRLIAVGVGSFSLSCTHLALTHVHPGQELWIQEIPEREGKAKERHVDCPTARAVLNMKELLLFFSH